MDLSLVLVIYLLCASLIGLLLCRADKYRARKNLWRIPEATLLLAGLLGGCFGLALGMQLFRHKTKHLTFRILVPVQCLLWIAALIYAALR